MKKIITLAIIALTSYLCTSQTGLRSSEYEQFLISTHFDTAASIKEQGINQVLEVEYAGPVIYTKLGIEYFQGLPVQPYFDWHGTIGASLVFGWYERYRVYAGIRGGNIYRGDLGFATFYGFETGITVRLNDQLRLGVRATRDFRTDQNLFNDPVFWRNSGFITLTYKIKNLR